MSEKFTAFIARGSLAWRGVITARPSRRSYLVPTIDSCCGRRGVRKHGFPTSMSARDRPGGYRGDDLCAMRSRRADLGGTVPITLGISDPRLVIFFCPGGDRATQPGEGDEGPEEVLLLREIRTR